MESHLRVEIVPRTDGSPATARIGDTEFPVLAYAIDLDDSGAPALSLVLQPDSLSIGKPPATTPPAPEAKVSSWGDGSQPDPRESIPGWQPEKLAGQVAGHAERVALRTWEPSRGQDQSSAFKRLVRLGYPDPDAAKGPTVLDRMRRLGLLPDDEGDAGVAVTA